MSKKNIVRILALTIAAAALAGLVVSCSNEGPQATRYHCPMHPTYISDKPGDCPICGMRLIPLEEKPAPTTVPAYACPMHPEVVSDAPGRCPKCGMRLAPTGAMAGTPELQPGSQPEGPAASGTPPATGGRRILHYRSPMDPSITSPVPAKDSMGMDYVPVYAEEQAASTADGVPGRAVVEISPQGLRLAGVRTEPATRESFARTIRAVGTVAADETRVRHVHTKIAGWVEKLYVNFTGQLVRKGEPILSIYSQELVASQEEYLKARETARRFSTSDLAEVRQGGEDLVQAARRRLELFDVPAAFIAELERTGAVRRAVTLDAPVSGYVTMKETFEGQQVDPAMELFTIADLSHVWLEADFYEYEARILQLGEEAVISLPYDAGTRLVGRVAYINPTLSTDTRTLKVRFEFPNPGLALKPGMYADVELSTRAVEGVVVPDSAVMDTGERQIVFVAKGAGVFEPREVKVGSRSGGRAQVLSGVAAGEQVVTGANFLIDSESRLRAALATHSPAPGTGSGQ